MDTKERFNWLCGSIAPLVTPLTEDERLDKAAFERLIDLQIQHGTQALFVLGSAGEGPMLTPELRREVLKEATRISGGKMPIIAGAMDNSVALVLQRLEELHKFEVSAGLVTLPYYGWKENKKSAEDFFLAVAEKSPIPVIVYNLPKVAGCEIPFETIEKLFDHPNIAGMKDSGNSPDIMKRIIKSPHRKKGFKFLLGNSSLAEEILLAGADGILSIHANYMPELIVNICNSARKKDIQRTKDLQKYLLELQKIMTYPNTAAGVKCALSIMGICSKRTMRPWPEATEKDEEEISKIIERVKKML